MKTIKVSKETSQVLKATSELLNNIEIDKLIMLALSVLLDSLKPLEQEAEKVETEAKE